MSLHFTVHKHTVRLSREAVEVRDGQLNLRAMIYPGDDDNEIRVVSKHLVEVRHDGAGLVQVRLRPEP